MEIGKGRKSVGRGQREIRKMVGRERVMIRVVKGTKKTNKEI